MFGALHVSVDAGQKNKRVRMCIFHGTRENERHHKVPRWHHTYTRSHQLTDHNEASDWQKARYSSNSDSCRLLIGQRVSSSPTHKRQISLLRQSIFRKPAGGRPALPSYVTPAGSSS